MRPIAFLLRGFLALALFAISLAFVPSASAQSAWVLWNETEDTVFSSSESREWSESHTWTVVMAGPNKARCEAEVARAIEQFAKDRGKHEKVEVKGNRVLVTNYSAEGSLLTATIHRFICFPDTVDPRGTAAQ